MFAERKNAAGPLQALEYFLIGAARQQVDVQMVLQLIKFGTVDKRVGLYCFVQEIGSMPFSVELDITGNGG